MRSTILVGLILGIAVLGLTWVAPRSEAQSGGSEIGGSAGWRAKHIVLEGKDEFVPAIRGRALVHSIIYSAAPGIISVVSVLATADPRDAEATIANITAPTTSGTGQIELDVEASEGLWIRGQGAVTVLYRPL